MSCDFIWKFTCFIFDLEVMGDDAFEAITLNNLLYTYWSENDKKTNAR